MGDILQEFYRRRSERIRAREDVTDKNGMEHAEAGSANGGQFVSKNGGGAPRNAEKAKGLSEKMGFNVSAKDAAGFDKGFHETRNSVKEAERWRVDGTYTTEDYAHMDCYETEDGGCFAIHDGDIVSVCAQGDKAKKKQGGKALLKAAVEAGGNRLDAFEGIAGFYLSCGFEPVSWTPFNEEYAPDGWKEAHERDGAEREDVVFFKYTGKVVDGNDERKAYMKDFKKRVKPCTGADGYDKAKEIRDNSIKEDRA